MMRFANWIDAKPHRFPLMLVVHTALLAAVLAATSFDLTSVVTRVALASTAAPGVLRNTILPRQQEVARGHSSNAAHALHWYKALSISLRQIRADAALSSGQT